MLARNDGDAVGELIASTSCNRELFGREVRDVYSDASRRPGARTAMVNYYRALARHRDTLNMGDFRVEVPTLMVWGEEDVAIHIKCTEGTEKWVTDLTLERLPGVSHWVQQDAPEKVNLILQDWLPNA